MVDFSRLIRQAEEARGRPPKAKRAGGARKPRRKAAEPPTAAAVPPVVEEPPIAEPIPTATRPPVPPPEAILEALIPTDPVATPVRVELPVEEPPSVRPAAPPPAEALAEAEIPTDPARAMPAAAQQPSIEDLARMAQDEADEGPEEAAPEPEAFDVAPSEPEPPIPEEAAPAEPGPPVVEPTASEAPHEALVDADIPVDEAIASGKGESPTEVSWESDVAAPVDDGLTPAQRTLVAEVRDLLSSLATEAPAVSEPVTATTAVLEEPRAPEPAPVAAAVEEAPQEEEPVAEPDLSPEQERLIAEVKAILVDLGVPPRREEEPVAAPADRIEDVPASLPGTDAVELPIEEAPTPPPAPLEPGAGDLGEILGVVREEASQAVADLDERAALAEALSPSPPLPEGLTETAPVAAAPSPEVVAQAFASPTEEPPPPQPQEQAPPPAPKAPAPEAPPPQEELMPFPPPMEEPPPPEEPPPRRRHAPFDPFSDLRRRGKDLLDVGILLVGLAWLAGGLYTGDVLSWVVALALIAAPSVDLYNRTTARHSEPT